MCLPSRVLLPQTFLLWVLLLLLPGASPAPAFAETPMNTPVSSKNPLLVPWSGPHGGVPPLDRVKVEHFKPALEQAMAAHLDEIDRIAKARGEPTFESTFLALEDSGRLLDRVETVYDIWGSTMADAAFQAVEQEMAPRLAAHRDRITQNAALFSRLEQVYQSEDLKRRSAEDQRLAWVVYTRFVRSGARLDPAAKERLAAINQELAGLYTRFGQNLLKDEETWVVIEDPAELAGLPASLRSTLAAHAKERGLEGRHIVLNTRSVVEPVLTYADSRALRERVWRAFADRGDRGGETDNNAIISRILSLRLERARLLGYPTHAHWRLENSMAKTPENALQLMEAVWAPAVARVREEVADQRALAEKEGLDIEIQPWDYRYYQEKVRSARYDLDQNEVKSYLQLERLREGMFWMADELYGLRFQPIQGIPVSHPDIRVWEVKDREDRHVGLWYFDPYARSGKRSGAWMNTYRAQERFKGEVSTIVSNNSNFAKPAPGEPVLISWDDARTLFHEFGHALHGLLSDVRHPTLAGTRVVRDFVEFPSQLHERWMMTPELLDRFAIHAETGQPIPKALVEKLERAATFNQGFSTVSYLSSALVDMRLHLETRQPVDPDAFEKRTLAALGMPDELVMRHRTPQFAHIFSGDGYAAGYYSYLWADTLTADATEAFEEAGSLYDEETARRLVETVLKVGNTVDPAESFRAFRGRDVRIEALMRARGFPVEDGRSPGE